jgi:hypothetical protein
VKRLRDDRRREGAAFGPAGCQLTQDEGLQLEVEPLHPERDRVVGAAGHDSVAPTVLR